MGIYIPPIMPSLAPAVDGNKSPDDQATQEPEKHHGGHKGHGGHHGGGVRHEKGMHKELMSRLDSAKGEHGAPKQAGPQQTAAAPKQQNAGRTNADGAGVGGSYGVMQLHDAIKKQDRELFTNLLDNGADPEASDPAGLTPLALALNILEAMCAENKSSKLVALANFFVVTLEKALLQRGALISAADRRRITLAKRWLALKGIRA
jgi:hypothetical protein